MAEAHLELCATASETKEMEPIGTDSKGKVIVNVSLSYCFHLSINILV